RLRRSLWDARRYRQIARSGRTVSVIEGMRGAAEPQGSRWQSHRKIPLGSRTARSRWLRISLGLLLENGESAGFFEQKRELAGKTCYGAGISGFSGWIGELNRQ
ncbi:hypothetical protein, partial [Paenibacillus zanthoxyli]|uniref:hypothetical protein n=1 Tax=Paenibacillus zanthoxyli TaxID=369399 RepID=UPI001E369784